MLSEIHGTPSGSSVPGVIQDPITTPVGNESVGSSVATDSADAFPPPRRRPQKHARSAFAARHIAAGFTATRSWVSRSSPI